MHNHDGKYQLPPGIEPGTSSHARMPIIIAPCSHIHDIAMLACPYDNNMITTTYFARGKRYVINTRPHGSLNRRKINQPEIIPDNAHHEYLSCVNISIK